MKDLGVKVVTGRALGTSPGDVTLRSLRDEQDYACVFLGIGLPNPNKDPIFAGLDESAGFFTSKTFLPNVAKASKPGNNPKTQTIDICIIIKCYNCCVTKKECVVVNPSNSCPRCMERALCWVPAIRPSTVPPRLCAAAPRKYSSSSERASRTCAPYQKR